MEREPSTLDGVDIFVVWLQYRHPRHVQLALKWRTCQPRRHYRYDGTQKSEYSARSNLHHFSTGRR